MINFLKKSKDNEKEKCGSCHQGELASESDEDGNHIKKFSCGHRKIEVNLNERVNVSDTLQASKKLVMVINENVTVSDDIRINLGLYFELTESVSISGIKKNSNDIELIFEEERPDMLKAFRINVKNFQDNKEIINALQYASRFTNLITLKTGMFVFHKRPRKIVNGKITSEAVGFSVSAVLTKLVNLDMTDNDLASLLNTNSRENQQLAHFANGQKALEDDDFVNAIKEFYQVLEYENLLEIKYKSLRDGLSHAELTIVKTINELGDEFGIVCMENPNSTLNPKGKYVDITSPEIQTILEKEANYLRNMAIRFIDSKVKVKTN